MTTFARQLAPALGRPVIDSTGLRGYYDADFDFTAELGPPPPPPGVAPVFESTKAPSIFAVLPQQLGLRLESDNGPVAFSHCQRRFASDRGLMQFLLPSR